MRFLHTFFVFLISVSLPAYLLFVAVTNNNQKKACQLKVPEIMNELLVVAGIPGSVTIQFHNTNDTSIHKPYDQDRPEIFLSKTHCSLSDISIRTVVAHEIGHFLAGHLDLDVKNSKDSQYEEHEANAFAIILVGEKNFKKGFLEARKIKNVDLILVGARGVLGNAESISELQAKIIIRRAVRAKE